MTNIKNEESVNVVIVGGGTAGWLTANFLVKVIQDTHVRSVDITLIESSDIPTIGVGEATTPSLKQTLSMIGIDEYEFMRECDATFKHGIKFSQWVQSPESNFGEYYFHPFQTPTRVSTDHATRHWLQLPKNQRKPFAKTLGYQQDLAEANYAPKTAQCPNYEGLVPYAYHLDAGKLAEFLKKKGKENGVKHIVSEVNEFKVNNQHNISTLLLKNGLVVNPDLLIDCTGFAAKFINHDGTNQFVDKTHQLFCDSALATRVEHAGISDIAPYTKSTAQKNGWIWDINLTRRRGVGHVYSSKYISDDLALKDLANYLGKKPEDIEARKLNLKIGYHREQWRGNCISIGLSGGFLEPLESTGIYLIEMAAWLTSQSVSRFLVNPSAARARFNTIMTRHYENIVDFIKAHYCLSRRTDSDFWRDNCDNKSIPESLLELLERWRYDPPNDYDFDSNIICFNNDNYQLILYGMTNPDTQSSQIYQNSEAQLKKLKNIRNVMLERCRATLLKNDHLMTQILDGKVSNHQSASITPSTNYKVR